MQSVNKKVPRLPSTTAKQTQSHLLKKIVFLRKIFSKLTLCPPHLCKELIHTAAQTGGLTMCTFFWEGSHVDIYIPNTLAKPFLTDNISSSVILPSFFINLSCATERT